MRAHGVECDASKPRRMSREGSGSLEVGLTSTSTSTSAGTTGIRTGTRTSTRTSTSAACPRALVRR